MLNKVKFNSVFKKTGLAISLMAMYIFLAPIGFSQGEDVFKANCSACHSTDDTKLVGPGLKGVTEKRSEEWLLAWTKNSTALIESGDEDAKAIYDEFGGMMMTSFDFLSDEEILSVFAYIDEVNSGADSGAEEEETAVAVEEDNGDAETNDTVASDPGEIEKSSGDFFTYGSIVVLILLIIWMLFGTLRSGRKAIDESGYMD